jgi:hypothetical protein
VRIAGVALLLVAATSRAARADDDDLHVAPCRPTVSCTADLAPPGTLELELGDQLRRVDANGDYQETTPFLIKLPLASWIEVQLGDNGYTLEPHAQYLDNIIVGGKLHFADQTAHRPSLALTISASIPTVAQEGYTRTTDLFVTAHASKDFGKLHVDANVGLNAWQVEGPANYQAFAVVAGTYAVTDKLGIALEPHYFTNAGRSASRDFGALAAVEYTVRPWLIVDGAIEVVFEDQGSVAGLAGISLAPVRLWDGH